MGKLKRYPQYVLMIDLLMLMLFVLIGIASQEEKGIRYHFVGDRLPSDCYLILYNPPNPTRHFSFLNYQWIKSNGIIDPGNTIFVKGKNKEDFIRFLPIPLPHNAGELMIGISGNTAQKVKEFVFKTCSDHECDRLRVYIDQHANIASNLDF
jgi:hypothetical protein